MSEDRRSRSTEAFFGRRRGKPMKPRQSGQYHAQLPKLRIAIDEYQAPASLSELFGHKPEKIRLEIGFGGGEHLVHEASRFPDIGFVGVEPFVNSMAKFLANASEEGLENLRVYDDDATQLLDWMPANSIDGIDLLYPDPWPKKKHWKRRFVNQQNLTRFARVMKPGSLFRFASDIDTYVNWTLKHCDEHPDFEWVAQAADDWHAPYEAWPGTRYEAKAFREGRTPAYLTFLRQ
ncbi:tRNA (guanosine(46)-N7)-methyltransferase TrmB [Ahrensia marina]|uniref:tRNA (guanine-N(7)-)-methyltransferase n=1 Tax=Ahrensia marina TaxID=1514904 RepID=A0A0M9GNW8_9HYPH|nr:tRNA (guanosine(46)-N7)-methyltransferase TrmB [Ahrensia marina]KPB01926.1 tRNA (guanine-N7)-methyltransferase [Ahrensia marina]